MSNFKENEFKNLKFRSVSYKKIECAVQLLKKLGYEEIHSDFSVYDAACHNGICAWDDGEITEGWLEDSSFKTVTIEELKGMVGETVEVLWLNKETLEERYLDKFSVFPYNSSWVEVPEGATFATGDKDNFVFRKDGWYYENGGWVETNVLLKHFPEYKYIKLFWVKSDIKGNIFTLERLLGCEVLFENRYQSSKGYITSFYNSCSVTLSCGGIIKLPNVSRLTFFTEDGDELTFDEYVKLYYPKG